MGNAHHHRHNFHVHFTLDTYISTCSNFHVHFTLDTYMSSVKYVMNVEMFQHLANGCAYIEAM